MNISRKVLTPVELVELLLARGAPSDHDLVHWSEASGEHTATVVAYLTLLKRIPAEAR